MNSTQLKTRLLKLAKEARAEADRHQGEKRQRLIEAARSLSFVAIHSGPAMQADHLEAGISVLVAAMSERAFAPARENR
jgi:hypothetical protein